MTETKQTFLIEKNQFGYMKGCGTREAIGMTRGSCVKAVWSLAISCLCVFLDSEKCFQLGEQAQVGVDSEEDWC